MSFTFQQALASLNASAGRLDVVVTNVAKPVSKGSRRPLVVLGSLHGNPAVAGDDSLVGPGAGARAIDLIFSRVGRDGNPSTL